jgi:hypothetical protein
MMCGTDGRSVVADADLLDRARTYLVQCGIHDAAIPGPCVCPEGDVRAVLLELVLEVEQLRAVLEDVQLTAMEADGYDCDDGGVR